MKILKHELQNVNDNGVKQHIVAISKGKQAKLQLNDTSRSSVSSTPNYGVTYHHN